MLVTVSLMSRKKGEIKRFLDSYYEKKSDADENVIEWIYVYRKISYAINIIDTMMDNYRDYDISVWIKIQDEDMVEVTEKSRKKIIKDILEIGQS